MEISNLEKWHFEITEGAANYLLGLVLEGKELGYTFSEDMPVIFEEFEIVEVLV